MLVEMHYFPAFLSSINGGKAHTRKENFNSFYKINQQITLQVQK